MRRTYGAWSFFVLRPQRSRAGLTCAAPTALRVSYLAYPALTRWANLCRAYGALDANRRLKGGNLIWSARAGSRFQRARLFAVRTPLRTEAGLARFRARGACAPASAPFASRMVSRGRDQSQDGEASLRTPYEGSWPPAARPWLASSG